MLADLVWPEDELGVETPFKSFGQIIKEMQSRTLTFRRLSFFLFSRNLQLSGSLSICRSSYQNLHSGTSHACTKMYLIHFIVANSVINVAVTLKPAKSLEKS